jgi:hypothetical protein
LRVLRHLVATTVSEDEPFESNLPDILQRLIGNEQRTDPLAMEVRAALGLPGGDPGGTQWLTGANKASYQSLWKQRNNGLLYHKGLLYVPTTEGARTEILRLHHNHPTAGQFANSQTQDLVNRKYYWPGLPRNVKEYCSTCLECQQNKAPTHQRYSDLQLLPTPTEPWSYIAMDFITELPKCTQRKGGQEYNAI